jgi:membrane-associated protein
MPIGEIVGFFIQYKYYAIFPLAFIEGPVVSIISGFLVSNGALALLPALLVVFFGDFLSDFVFYLVGRGGRRAMRYVRFLHIHEDKLELLEKQYEVHPWKTMIIAKVSYGLGIAFMIAAGASRVSYQKFLIYTASLNFIRSVALIGVGFYFGKAALRFGPTYLWYYGLSVLIAIPIILFLRKKFFKNNLDKKKAIRREEV